MEGDATTGRTLALRAIGLISTKLNAGPTTSGPLISYVVDAVLATLSVLGGLLMILPFLASSSWRHKVRHKLILGLGISDCATALCVLIPSAYLLEGGSLASNSAGCKVGAFFYQVSVLTSSFWALAIAVATYALLALPLHHCTEVLYYPYTFVLCFSGFWLLGCVIAGFGVALFRQADVGGFCFYSGGRGDRLYGQLSLFIPRTLVFTITIALYIRLFFFFRRQDAFPVASDPAARFEAYLDAGEGAPSPVRGARLGSATPSAVRMGGTGVRGCRETVESLKRYPPFSALRRWPARTVGAVRVGGRGCGGRSQDSSATVGGDDPVYRLAKLRKGSGLPDGTKAGFFRGIKGGDPNRWSSPGRTAAGLLESAAVPAQGEGIPPGTGVQWVGKKPEVLQITVAPASPGLPSPLDHEASSHISPRCPRSTLPNAEPLPEALETAERDATTGPDSNDFGPSSLHILGLRPSEPSYPAITKPALSFQPAAASAYTDTGPGASQGAVPRRLSLLEFDTPPAGPKAADRNVRSLDLESIPPPHPASPGWDSLSPEPLDSADGQPVHGSWDDGQKAHLTAPAIPNDFLAPAAPWARIEKPMHKDFNPPWERRRSSGHASTVGCPDGSAHGSGYGSQSGVHGGQAAGGNPEGLAPPQDSATSSGTDGQGKRLSAQEMNRRASLLMLLYPAAYIVLFSVSIGRIIVEFANGRPSNSFKAVSKWLVLSSGWVDACIFIIIEWQFRKASRRRAAR